MAVTGRLVLLVEETGGPGENHHPVTSHWQTWSHDVAHLALIRIRTHNISGCCWPDIKSVFRTKINIFKKTWLFIAQLTSSIQWEFEFNKRWAFFHQTSHIHWSLANQILVNINIINGSFFHFSFFIYSKFIQPYRLSNNYCLMPHQINITFVKRF